MSEVMVAGIAALAVVLLSFAQDAFPGLAFYHTWQYALALAVGIVLAANYAMRRRRYRLAMLGIAAVGLAGLYAGLAGADTALLMRGPGQTVHAAGGAVVHFPITDAQQVRAGTAVLDVAGRGPLRPGGRSYADSSVLISQMHPAAYIDAYDAAGRHLTITQPQGTSFLSPLLLFPSQARLRDRTYAIDVFALPALSQTVQAFYFTPADIAAVQHVAPPRDAAVLVALTGRNRALVPHGIAFLRQGAASDVGGVHLTASIGHYPVLVVASAPWPPLLIGGALLAIAGVLMRRRKENGALSADGAA
ncbi:LPXTG cell wall anchor domain-containing protein [bacterium]|nr:MAG: LPXTG cell wall anchor domain-containing protein [bacterium]